jgi:tetratricopeptide (TPR) repeat protein
MRARYLVFSGSAEGGRDKAMRKSVLVFFILIVLLLIGNSALLFFMAAAPPQDSEPGALWDSERLVGYANKLIAKGLNAEAIDAYEEYIRISRDPARDVAPIAYRLGQLYMQTNEYQKALGAFYKAEALDPGADYKSDMDRMIVRSLEELGMTTQARYELGARSSLTHDADGAETVVARIGKEFITADEVNRALDALPEWLRQQYEEPEGRQQFIREYLTQEVLYKKAKRLGLDKKSALRQQLAQVERQLVIQALLEREVGSQLEISAREIELFYKANKEKYVEEEAIKVAYVTVNEGDEGAATQEVTDAEAASDDRWITRDRDPIPGEAVAPEVMDALFNLEVDDVSGPHAVGDKNYFFKVTEKRPARQKPFEEVRSEVEFELGSEKQQELIASLIEKTLEEQEVEIVSSQ